MSPNLEILKAEFSQNAISIIAALRDLYTATQNSKSANEIYIAQIVFNKIDFLLAQKREFDLRQKERQMQKALDKINLNRPKSKRKTSFARSVI